LHETAKLAALNDSEAHHDVSTRQLLHGIRFRLRTYVHTKSEYHDLRVMPPNMANQALKMIYITQSKYACSVSLFGRPAVQCVMTLQGQTTTSLSGTSFMLSQHLLRCPDSSSLTSPPVVRFLRSQHGVPRRRNISNMAIEDCTQPMHGNNITASSNLFRRKGDSMPRSSDKTYSLASVASHSTPSDCWVIVRDKVYDVTAWVPQHPGGALIYVSAGKDCTQLFDSYHPLYARYQS
jgi:cytochrome b involved in lipid metabolism